MFNIFKKEPQQKEVAEMERKSSNNKLVEEIHSAFYSEVDKLLKDSKTMFVIESEHQSLVDKREKLIQFGFYECKDVAEIHDEAKRLDGLKETNQKNKTLNEAINYFSFKYPHYRFITEESVEKLCEKYGLVFGDAHNYIGEVPDKNLAHIEQFKIDEQDECWCLYKSFPMRYTEYLSKEEAEVIAEINNEQYKGLSRENKKYSRQYIPERFGLEIVAPAKMFDNKHTKIVGNRVVAKDPIVLNPVLFKGAKYYLIVTAWGKEASDESVVNPTNN